MKNNSGFRHNSNAIIEQTDYYFMEKRTPSEDTGKNLMSKIAAE